MTTTLITREWLLDAYPTGIPDARHFRLAEREIPPLKAGEVLVKTIYLSMDPFPRLRLDPESRMGLPVPIGSVMIGRGAGRVIASLDPTLQPGDAVSGELGWREYASLSAASVRKADTALAPLSAPLHLLGSSGLAPYFALTESAKVRAGDTVVVTAAAGSVGIAAGQIASLLEARPVGIVRGAEQERFLEGRFGYAAVVDGESPDFARRVHAACPTGIDVLVDSVGGALHDRLMGHIAPHARIVLLGFISAYNVRGSSPPEYGRIYELIRKRATMCGFLLPDFADSFASGAARLAKWIAEGKLCMPEAITHGFEHLPEAFAAMFGAAQPGKHLVQVAPDTTSQQNAEESRE